MVCAKAPLSRLHGQNEVGYPRRAKGYTGHKGSLWGHGRPDFASTVQLGSLTMPACTEGVRWIVFQDIYVIRLDGVERLHEAHRGLSGLRRLRHEQQPADAAQSDREIERS